MADREWLRVCKVTFGAEREAEQQRRFELRQAKKRKSTGGINVHLILVIVHIGELYQN